MKLEFYRGIKNCTVAVCIDDSDEFIVFGNSPYDFVLSSVEIIRDASFGWCKNTREGWRAKGQEFSEEPTDVSEV